MGAGVLGQGMDDERIRGTRDRLRREMERHVARFGTPPVGISAQPRRCIYTCGRGATTSDHIPSKGLLVGVVGPRLTVPSCLLCNGGSSEDDEYLRVTLTINIQAGAHPAARAAWETAWRGLKRPEAAGFKRSLFDSITPVDVVDASGRTARVPGFKSIAFRQSRVAARIARAVYYHETGGTLPDHLVVAWPSNFLVQRELGEHRLTDACLRMTNFAATNPGTELGAGVLKYWWQALGGRCVASWLVFFGGMPFLGVAMPRDARMRGHWLLKSAVGRERRGSHVARRSGARPDASRAERDEGGRRRQGEGRASIPHAFARDAT